MGFFFHQFAIMEFNHLIVTVIGILICCSCLVVGEEPFVVDLMGAPANSPREPPKVSRIHPDQNVVLVLVNWGGEVDQEVEKALWRLATHQNIVAITKIQISARHRAKNTGIDEIINAMNSQKTIMEKNPSEKRGIFTHALL